MLFIDHGGTIVRVLGYASATRWIDHESKVVNAVRSFRTERDAKVLGIEPARLEIVRLPSRMTFLEFTEAYPSTLDVQKLADLNRRTVTEVLEAGTLVKRVVGGRLP